MANGSSMIPPIYYSAVLQFGGQKYETKWRKHRGQLVCIEAPDDIKWIMNKDFLGMLPVLVDKRIYIRFDQKKT